MTLPMSSRPLRGRDETPSPQHQRRARAWQHGARLTGAGVSGVLLYLTFEPNGLWWLAPLGLAMFFAVLRGRMARAAFGYGLVAGLGMMLPLLWWTGEFVGTLAPLALATTQAVLVAVAAVAIAITSRVKGAPLWAALLWAAGETLRSVVPFGGFPWTKLAFGQVDGVFVPLVTVGSTPLVAFAVALCGFSAAELLWRMHGRRTIRHEGTSARRRGANLILVVGMLAPIVAGLAASLLVDATPTGGTVTVAAVQGNVPRAGLDFNAERRAVLDNHVRETERLAADVAAGRVSQPELVIWPENSSDIDPYANADAAAAIDRAADAIGVPILVGAVVGGDGPQPRNTMLLWEPGSGPADEIYSKRRLQPFGETMPMRDFFRLFSEEVDHAGRFVPGTDPVVLAAGPARVAIAMCYEVIFDDAVRESVLNGANLLAVPSNNATFGYSDMTFQQLAIDRVRAIEHGRSVVVATTSGVSAIIEPDGTVIAQTGMFEPATLVARVPLRTTATIADRIGPASEWLLTLAGVAALAVVVAGRRRR